MYYDKNSYKRLACYYYKFVELSSGNKLLEKMTKYGSRIKMEENLLILLAKRGFISK